MRFKLIKIFIVLSIFVSCQSDNKIQYVIIKEQLDSIFDADQTLRNKLDSIEQKYGYESKEALEIWQKINKIDSINQIKVSAILDEYGWLGSDKIGGKANVAFFAVLQHSNLKTQEKYLPIMKEAVKKGNANGEDLALLIDRIEMFNGRPQVYGSQIQFIKGKYTVYPIIDECNVNKRRSEIGLKPLEEYLTVYNINYMLPK